MSPRRPTIAQYGPTRGGVRVLDDATIGALVLFPSMVWLLRVFKRRPAFALLEDEGSE